MYVFNGTGPAFYGSRCYDARDGIDADALYGIDRDTRDGIDADALYGIDLDTRDGIDTDALYGID